MDMAGDIIQAICSALNIEDLQSTADFPDDMDHLHDILVKVCNRQHHRKVLWYSSSLLILSTVMQWLPNSALTQMSQSIDYHEIGL